MRMEMFKDMIEKLYRQKRSSRDLHFIHFDSFHEQQDAR